jgi:glycosyltransferase involved in cell wall biosynthesis
MKVLHVIPNFSVVGGAEMMLSRLIVSRPDCQHYVVALMHEVDDTFHAAVDACVMVTALHWNGRNTLSVLLKLRRIIADLAPDVLQSWMYHANVLCSLSVLGLKPKPKLVWGIHHSLAALKEESWATKIALGLGRVLIKHCDAVVYCAQSSLQQHQAIGYRHPVQVVIANGIELAHFQPSQQVGLPLQVGFAGRLHPAKGFAYLFKTIALLKDQPVHFRIAGQGVSLDNPHIQHWIAAEGVDLRQLTLLDRVEDMPAFYQSIELLLLTSITEGLPTVLIEAMASGVPCISSDVGDAALMIENCGYVVPARAPERCQMAILDYLNLAEADKKQLKLAAQARAQQRFALQQVSQAYLDLWMRVK